MIYIEVPDMNDSISNITIDNVEYGIRFTYNEVCDYWSIGIYDADNQPIVAMTRLVPNFPIFYYFSSRAIPKGCFGCISETEYVGRDAFRNGYAKMAYMTVDDLKALGLEDEFS